jgi:hypothetical protein
MTHVVRLTEQDLAELQLLVMDRDAPEALRFLRDKVLKPIDRSNSQKLDPSKGSHQ